MGSADAVRWFSGTGRPVDGLLFPSGPAVRVDPRTVRHPGCRIPSSPEERVVLRHPGIGYRVVTDATIRAGFGGAVTGSRVVLPSPNSYKQHSPSPVTTPGYRWHVGSERRALVGVERPRRPTPVGHGILLAEKWTANWYHWLVDGLPRVWLATRLPPHLAGAPLIVGAGAVAIPTIREILRIVAPDTELVVLEPGEYARVQELILVDGPNRSPHPASRDTDSISVPHGEAMREYRSHLLGLLRSAAASPSPRTGILLDRPPSTGRPYNDREVRGMLVRNSVMPVRTDRLAVAEQAAAVGGARGIIGPSGAAFTNLLFSRETSRAFVWGPESVRGLAIWGTLAEIAGIDVTGFQFPSSWRGNNSSHPGYHIDVDWLEEELSRAGAFSC